MKNILNVVLSKYYKYFYLNIYDNDGEPVLVVCLYYVKSNPIIQENIIINKLNKYNLNYPSFLSWILRVKDEDFNKILNSDDPINSINFSMQKEAHED
ncbi:MAG: hypothetical protein HC877_18820 [Thioploca sp.]|nr:hypothetical protein [Thioploca sp.]